MRETLERLRGAGLRLDTLTDSTQRVAEDQMKDSGLGGYFEQVLAADAVKRLKSTRIAAAATSAETASRPSGTVESNTACTRSGTLPRPT